MKQNSLTLHYVSDFAGCGFLRTHFVNEELRTHNINEHLNSLYGQKKLYEGIVSSRIVLEKRLLPAVKNIRFQRQITDDQIKLIEMVKQLKEVEGYDYQIIYDHDDLLTDIPDYNHAIQFYNQPFVKTNLAKITNLVDIVTTSTYDLKKEFESYKGDCKVKIVPNFLPKFIYRPYEFIKAENKKPKIVWAGSSSHFSPHNPGDLGLVLDLIKNTVDIFDWVFIGINEMPIWLSADIANKVKLIPWIRNIHSFPTILKELNADFGIAPLLNNRFNQCKSSIKLLDYFSSDIIAMASNIAPYKKESQLFFSGDWQTDRDTIIDIFQNKDKKDQILHKQRKISDQYWMETKGVSIYKKILNINNG